MRVMAKLLAIMDNTLHPPQDTVSAPGQYLRWQAVPLGEERYHNLATNITAPIKLK